MKQQWTICLSLKHQDIYHHAVFAVKTVNRLTYIWDGGQGRWLPTTALHAIDTPKFSFKDVVYIKKMQTYGVVGKIVRHSQSKELVYYLLINGELHTTCMAEEDLMLLEQKEKLFTF